MHPHPYNIFRLGLYGLSNPSLIVDPKSYFLFQCSTTGIIKAMLCAILSGKEGNVLFNNALNTLYLIVCGMVYIKDPLLLIRKSSPCSCGSGFSLFLLEGSEM